MRAYVIGPSSLVEFDYDGLGDRMRQTVDSNPTNYAIDIAAGLTQVLADNENAYLYGLGRIAQQEISVTQYFLGDALGSVRQLVDEDGTVTLPSHPIPGPPHARPAKRSPRRCSCARWRLRGQ